MPERRDARSLVASLALIAAVIGANASVAEDFEVLWFVGGVEERDIYGAHGRGTYGDRVGALVERAASPDFGPGHNWHVTFWDSGPMPTGVWDVLVVQSGTGSWDLWPFYPSLLAEVTTGDFGARVVVTEQAADLELFLDPTDPWDGPTGFIINSVNWAASGNGMGGVFLESHCSSNFTLRGVHLPSCPSEDLSVPHTLFSGLGPEAPLDDGNMIIPSGAASFPINLGLTSRVPKGLLSRGFEGIDTNLWRGISVSSSGSFVTLVSTGRPQARPTEYAGF